MSQHGSVIEKVMSSDLERLLQIIADTSFLSSSEPVYPLASGVLSKYYVDCRRALSHPEARQLVGDLVVQQLNSIAVDAVGGMALGAFPVAIAVSDAFYRRGKTVRSFVVRKESKGHGLKKHVEGDVAEGDRVLIVDDVITSGKSTTDAITKSREEGLTVIGAIAVIDRQESNGAMTIKNCGVPFHALLTLQNLIDIKAK